MNKYISRFARFSFAVTAISIAVYILAIRITPIADFVNSTVSVAVRFLLSSLTYLLPFSFFELLIILSPILLILVVLSLAKRADSRAKRVRSVISLIAVIALIFTAYIYTLGIGYRTTRLAKRLDIEDNPKIYIGDLTDTIDEMIDGINRELPYITLSDDATRMPYSQDEMSKRLIHAYDLMNEEHSLLTNYTSRVKGVRFSTVMSDLGITGIYSFFTGEANVNTEYPDYGLPFTAAHELAHQRGISRENEASFVAFLVCIASDDSYIRYSGYLNMLEYLLSALYGASSELYYEYFKTLPTAAISDIEASYDVYYKHRDSLLGKINDKLNDAYLKANGTEGIVSYSYVVRLTVSYYQKENNR